MLKRAVRRARRAVNGDVLDEVAQLRTEVAALRADQTQLRAMLEGDMKAIVAQLEQALLTIAFAGAKE